MRTKKTFLNETTYIATGILGVILPAVVIFVLIKRATAASGTTNSHLYKIFFVPYLGLIVAAFIVGTLVFQEISKAVGVKSPSWKKAFFLIGAMVLMNIVATFFMSTLALYGFLLLVAVVAWVELAKKTYSITGWRAIGLWFVNLFIFLLIIGIIGFMSQQVQAYLPFSVFM